MKKVFLCFFVVSLMLITSCVEEPSEMLVETSTKPIYQAGSVFRELIVDGLAIDFAKGQIVSWTDVDLTSFGVPTNAHMVVIQVTTWATSGLPIETPPFYTRFRRPDESADTNESNWFYSYPPHESNDIHGSDTIFIPLTDGEFEYTKTYRCRCEGKLIGYFLNPAD